MASYRQAIHCLPRVLGHTAAETAGGATEVAVDAAAAADPGTAAGAVITLGGQALTITAVSGQTLTVSPAAGGAQPAGAEVWLAAHWEYAWTPTATLITTCPTDPAFPVDTGSAKIVEVKETGTVKIQQSGFNTATRLEMASVSLEADPGQTVTTSISWPYDVTIMKMEAFYSQTNYGDTITTVINEDFPLGYVAQAVAPGDTVVRLGAAAFAYVKVGHRAKLFEGATVNDLGRVLAVDIPEGTVTVAAAAADAFTTAALFLDTIQFSDATPVPGFQTSFTIGGDKIAGSDIPANFVLKATYQNNGALASRVVVYLPHLV